MSFGSENNKNLLAFHSRARLYLAHVGKVLLELCQDTRTQFAVRHLASTEPDSGLNFVAALEPFTGMLHTIVVVVVIGAGPKLDLLDGDRYLLLLRFVGLLLRFVLKLSEIDDAANWRIGSGCDLDKIQSLFSGGADGIAHGKNLLFHFTVTKNQHERHFL